MSDLGGLDLNLLQTEKDVDNCRLTFIVHLNCMYYVSSSSLGQ